MSGSIPKAHNRPKILLITRNLPPLVGGMERLMQQLACGMADYADLSVIGPRGCGQTLPGNVQIHETSEKLLPFLLSSAMLAILACQKTRFDIVLGGSGLIAPTLKILARIFGCKTVIYLHGLDLVVDNFWYQHVFIPCLRRINLTIVNSQNTRRIAISKGVPEKRIVIVNPGTTIPDLPSEEELIKFRSDHGIVFDKVIIFVGRMTQRKGLSAFIDRCLPDILFQEPGAGLVIVGKNPKNSLNQLGEEKEVLSAISRSQYRERIFFLGQLGDVELKTCYAIADVQILPLVPIKGDIEGFGMVAIEAAALGTPTIAFSIGGVADAISTGSGQLIPEGQYGAFGQAVLEVLRGTTISVESCRKHAANFNWDTVNSRFRIALARVVKKLIIE